MEVLLLCSGRVKKRYGCGPRRKRRGMVDQNVLEPAFRQRGLNDYPSSGGNKKVCQIGQGTTNTSTVTRFNQKHC